MKNIISKSYEAVDNGLMYLTNKAVGAWNWTTGGTKADLANFLLSASGVCASSGIILRNPYFSPFAAGYLVYCHVIQNLNKDMEQKEVAALEHEMLSYRVENRKRDASFLGPFDLSLTASNQLMVQDIPSTFIGAGLGLLGASYYVVRADCIPPRKNVLRRAKDKLEEIIKNVREGFRAPVPVPVVGM